MKIRLLQLYEVFTVSPRWRENAMLASGLQKKQFNLSTQLKKNGNQGKCKHYLYFFIQMGRKLYTRIAFETLHFLLVIFYVDFRHFFIAVLHCVILLDIRWQQIKLTNIPRRQQ